MRFRIDITYTKPFAVTLGRCSTHWIPLPGQKAEEMFIDTSPDISVSAVLP
jgi:hypothetical protein